MTTEQKKQIIDAAQVYIKLNKLSNNEVAHQASINSGYLSVMLRGTFHTTVNNKEVEISDKWFLKLAHFVGFSLNKTYWKTIPVIQFKEIYTTLEDAKDGGKTAMIIGDTGQGKTNAIDAFVRKYPQHTYRVTVSSLYKLVDIMNELGEKVNIEHSTVASHRIQMYSLKVRMDAIVDKLIDVKRSGGKPIIIFDEGENLEIAVLKMLKALYDGLKDHCAIVLIGTDQLMTKLLNLRKRNRDAIPQLYRRFKAGQITISPIVKKRDFKPFFDLHVPDDKGLQKLLTDISDNYGELHDYLEPALREADEKGEPLTEDFFRLKYNMPKY